MARPSPITGTIPPKGNPFKKGEDARERGRKGGQNRAKNAAARKTLR